MQTSLIEEDLFMPIRRKRLFLRLALPLAALLVLGTSALSSSAAAPKAAAPASTSSTDVPYTTTTVLIGDQQVIGALYQPTEPDPNQSTALMLTHENNDFIGSIPCVQFAQRGFTVLCVKSQFDDHAVVMLDDLALDVGDSVTYLRTLPTVHRVVLVGWSGGGGVMSYYQNVAQNGLAACQAPARLDPCGDDLAHLPPADGVIFLDANPGIAFDRLSAFDASVVDETDLDIVDKSLDMFSPTNGYSSTGSSNYSGRFVRRYTQGQGDREGRIIARAQKLQKQVANGSSPYTDDAPMPTGRDGAEIWQADLSLLSHTKGKYSVISPQHPQGGAPQVVHSVRVTSASSATNQSWDGGGNAFTSKSYLSSSAIKAPDFRVTADSITGVDWQSSNSSTVNNVKGISVPLLIMSMTGHYFMVPSEMYYQQADRAKDKTLIFVEGATHGFTPCTACATTPGEFGDTVAETFNYATAWLTAHYPS
jgi:hypothetical protein